MDTRFIVFLWALLNTFTVILKRESISKVGIEHTFILNYMCISVFILGYLFFYKGWKKTHQELIHVKNNIDLYKTSFLLAIFYICFQIINHILLSYDDISLYIAISNIFYLISITLFSVYYYRDKMNYRKGFAIGLLCIASYLLET